MDLTFLIENDPEKIAKLNRTVHQKHAIPHSEIFKQYHYKFFLKWFQELFKNKNVYCAVVKDGEQYIGYALIMHKKSPVDSPFLKRNNHWFHIDQMSIEAPYQNKGIGVQLFNFIKQFAKEKGVTRIQLDVWSDNDQAKRFYEKIGFKTVREILEIKVD